ncbi:uncharacterized protein LOC144135100 [Amblyomma americanum]
MGLARLLVFAVIACGASISFPTVDEEIDDVRKEMYEEDSLFPNFWGLAFKMANHYFGGKHLVAIEKIDLLPLGGKPEVLEFDRVLITYSAFESNCTPSPKLPPPGKCSRRKNSPQYTCRGRAKIGAWNMSDAKIYSHVCLVVHTAW